MPQADHFRILLEPAKVADAFVTQRERFARTLEGFDAEALSTPSRCELWTVADVLRHGCDVDEVMGSLWSGQPSKWASGFDPRTTPHEGVEAQRDQPDGEVRDRYLASTDEIVATVRGYGPERWGDPSFSPVGAVPWWLSMTHSLFDAWLHERDALAPLGLPLVVDETETASVLTYSLGIAGLTRFFEVQEPFGASVAGSWVTVEPVPVVTAGRGDPPDGLAEVTGDAAAITDAVTGRGAVDAVARGEAATLDALGAFGRFLNG